MKTILYLTITTVGLSGQLTFGFEMPVIDPSMLLQVAQQIDVAKQTYDQISAEVTQLGNPASFLPAGASQIIQSLGQTGVGKTWTEIRELADGVEAMLYDGHGLYRPIGKTITTAEGVQVERAPEDYKKYDALAEATQTLEAVIKDTENRRREVINQIKETTELLRTAQTVTEIQKHQGVLTAQATELGAIDREREAAMNRVHAQKIENDSDVVKQEEARKEERVVDFQAAQEKLGQFLIPDTSPVTIPDPRAP